MKVKGSRSSATRPAPEYGDTGPAVDESAPAVTIDIYIERLPEGVFLGTSPQIAGLTVETNTRDEMIEEARAAALELRDLAGLGRAASGLRFRFIEFG